MARSAPNFKEYIESITITSAGSNYSSQLGDVSVLISPPTGAAESEQIQATAEVEINNGQVTSIQITSEGDGYRDAPEIAILSPLKSGGAGLINTTSADSRRSAGLYTNVPLVSSKTGTGARISLIIDNSGSILSYSIIDDGSLYREGETVTVLDIDIGGVNNAPDITFTVDSLKGGGKGATFDIVLQKIAKGQGYYHDNMSYISDSQIPEFIKTDYPNFARFIKDYYRFEDLGQEEYTSLNISNGSSESQYSPTHLLQEMIDKINIDHNDPDFLQPMLEQYALDFPTTAAVDSRMLIKHMKTFLESKGSRQGIQQFFKLMYNEDVEVFLPSEFILRPSDGIYRKELTVKAYANTEISPVPNPLNLRGRRASVHYYESTASITKRKIINTSVTRVKKIAYTAPEAFELTLDLPGDTIIPGQGVEGEITATVKGKIASVGSISAADALRTASTQIIASNTTPMVVANPNISGSGARFTVTIDSSGAATIGLVSGYPGTNYVKGEQIVFPASYFGGGANLTCNVATITEGKLASLTIADAGAGYSANPDVIVLPHPDDTITTTAVVEARLTNGSISNVLFVNNTTGVGYNNVPTIVLNTDAVRSWIGVEGSLDTITDKTAFLTRVLNKVSLKTNSGTSNGGFVIGETFKVSETGDILGVYAIDYFGEDYTITGIDNNAVVRIKTLDSNNYPAFVEVISTGTGFQRESFDFILRSATNETTTLTCNTGFSHTYPGSFKNSQGFLSDANRIQDNSVYQNFAYQVRTSRPKTQWGELLDRIAHPAGMIAWTDLQINQLVDMGSSFNALPDIIVFRIFADIENVVVQDAPQLFFHRPNITDSIDWSDKRTGASDDTILLLPNLNKVETPSFDDTINKFDIVFAKTEDPVIQDAPALDFHRPNITDSVDWSEIVDILFFIARDPIDSVDWAEVVTRVVGLNKQESVDWNDVANLSPGLVKADPVELNDTSVTRASENAYTEDPLVDESNVLLFATSKTESAVWGESGKVIAQNYAGDYFAEDYVGEVRNIS
jgi:hypothetical protein